jgi:hypothetical protein
LIFHSITNIAVVGGDNFMQKINYSTEMNTSVIQSLYGTFASGNIEGAAALLTSDFIMHVPGRGRNAGEYWGREGFKTFASKEKTKGKVSYLLPMPLFCRYRKK